MTAVSYFAARPANETVPVVCPACGTAFPVPIDVLRASPTVGCPACHHVRPSPAVPSGLRARSRQAPRSEFPRTSTL